MIRKKRKREVLRQQAARRLLELLHRRATDSVATLEALASHLKAENPDLADRVDWVMGQAIGRARLMPEAVTALYLAHTQKPPTVIDGEVVAVGEVENQAPEAGGLEAKNE